MRTAPAPWAEFEFDNIILTVPSHLIRELENLDEVAVIWNGIMKAVADLAASKLPRKERIVADVQISAGMTCCHILTCSNNFSAACVYINNNGAYNII